MDAYELSKAALLDLKEIYQFGIEKFGASQAINYIEEIENQCALLSLNPSIGRRRPEIDSLTFSFPYKAHLIFYEQKERVIFINRILHGSRDFQNFSNLY